MKKPLKEALKGRFYLDGGSGSSFLAMGLADAHSELYPLTEPQAVAAVHRSFFEAGADAVLTDTFGCNSRKADLSKYSLSDIIEAAVGIARSVADEYGKYVLYDCGPTGALLEPNGSTTFEEAYDLFAEQARIVAGLPVDGVIIETISDLQEMRAAFLAFKENTDLPILCSMTFEKGGRTFTGTSIESYAVTMQALGADAVGINCGTGPRDMLDNARRLVSCAYVPVFVEPNAGLPRLENGKTIYDTDAEAFSDVMKEVCASGVNILGGCCGTTPEYIEKTVKKTENLPVLKHNTVPDALCSASRVVAFGTDSVVIGERLNPTGKPTLKQAILNSDFDYMLSVCMAEKQEGADVLDVNLGVAGINETEMLPQAVRKIQGIVDLPLCIDTAKADALKKAVRIACGRCLINSVNGSMESMKAVFPVAKKYGSYVVALCLDEDGIPETADGRIAIAKRILSEAEKYGIEKERFLFDPLTMAVSVDKNNALITLDVLKRLRQEIGVKTTLGLSNVSFGLPNRLIINSTFYTMALEAGTTSAIINPTLKAGFDAAAYDLLTGNDPSCEKYIAACQGVEVEKKEVKLDLSAAIVRGLVGEAMAQVKEKADENNFAAVIDEDVIGGLNRLGSLYADGKVFLPQLIAGSEAAKAVLEFLKNRFIPEGGSYKATVVLATVKGDVHDIGKNIVKAVVGNYGYRIVDLGKDVSKEEVLAAVERYKPEVVGLSALMTTTLDSMTETTALLRETHPEVTVMVGGAVVTAEFAEQIGALYSKDAREMAEILEKRFS